METARLSILRLFVTRSNQHECLMQPVFTQLINLDGSTDRLSRATEALGRENIEFTRSPAFDGRGIAPANLPRYISSLAWLWFGRPLTGGEVGCFLSHRDSAERFLASDARHGLVLEDDISLPEGFGAFLHELIGVIEGPQFCDLRLVNLTGLPRKAKYYSPVTTIEAEAHEYALCTCYDFPLSTAAILWSRAGAERFLTRARFALGSVDNMIRSDLARHGGGYCLSPPPVTTVGESTITTEASDAHSFGTRKSGWWQTRSKQRARYRHLWAERRRRRDEAAPPPG